MGPVFVLEWVTAARRWQMYAVRALFVAVLLATITIVWATNVTPATQFGPNRKDYEKIGDALFQAFVGTQLAVILLAAPAATAGSVCLDKARGNLLHLLVTDLRAREIILGKLAARLIPVLGLLASSVPVLMVCTWFGGLDPETLLGAYAVTGGVAAFGCALTLLLSVWGRKTHEVLIAAYLIEVLLLVAQPAAGMIESYYFRRTIVSDVMGWANPFIVAYGPYWRPGTADPAEPYWFLGVCLALAAAFALLGVLTVRRVTVRQCSQPQRARRGHRPWRRRGGWLSPSLDRNPVLWREWHRQRPSLWVRCVWLAYALVAGGATAVLVVTAMVGGRVEPGLAAFTSGLQVSVGLLLVSVSAVTALAEERVRGSLDVLLTTALPTPAIVWGKWRGAFRSVPRLAVLPTINVVVLAAGSGRWLSVAYMVALVLAYGAAVTSLGLALATWVKRLGRAVALSATLYALVTVGWFAIVAMVFNAGGRHTFEALASASPFFGPGQLTYDAGQGQRETAGYVYLAVWIAVYALTAVVLYLATRATFDWCLGRISDGRRFTPTVPPRPKGARSRALPSVAAER